MTLTGLRWPNWSLQAQVTFVILLVVLAFETASVGLDYVQIRQNHRSEIRNRGGAFVREVLPVLVAVPPEERSAVAKQFNSSERTLRLGDQPGITAQDATHRYPRIAIALEDRFRKDGFEIEALMVADRRIVMSDADNNVFGDFLTAGQRFSTLSGDDRPPEPATLSILSLKLSDALNWYDFYILTAPMSMVPLLIMASLDTIIALIFTVFMIALIRRILGPMNALSQGAELLGRGEQIDALTPQGSRDVRETVLAFNRMSERVRQAYDYQSSLIQSLGHDLRGPLDRVRRLAKRASPEAVQDDLVVRINAVDDIIGSVTSFTRATRRDGGLVRVDLPSLLDALVDEQVDLGNICSLDIKANVTVKGRHNALMRTFRNLIENAIKYGNLARATLDRSDGFAIVTVDDEGEGIAQDQLQSAFRPFERLNAQGKGSGLGLAIVKAIIVDHGGEIELTNLHPHGLRATVRLPLDPVEVNRT
ncbi:MAG: ATP-binding protein [Sedimentitalea sp.]